MPTYALYTKGQFDRVAYAESKPQDHPQKGLVWYETALEVGENVGWRIEDGVAIQTVAPPSPPGDFEVNQERTRRLLAGCTINITGLANTVRVEGNETTVTNLQGLVTAAQLRLANNETTHITNYRDADDVIHQLLPAQIIQLWSKSAGYVDALYNASWTIKSPNETPEDYANNAYWPPTTF